MVIDVERAQNELTAFLMDECYSGDYFFHLSTRQLESTYLEPRVPGNRLVDEDGVTPRVCVSDSVIGCMSAIKDQMYGYIISQRDSFGKREPLYLYCVRKNAVKLVVTPQELAKNQLVRDALMNSEYWILDECVKMELFACIKLKVDRFVIVDPDIDCSSCCVDCDGCETPDDWDGSKGSWEYRKGCIYPYVDEGFDVPWEWEFV